MNRRLRLAGMALVSILVLGSSPALGQGSPEEPTDSEGMDMGDDRLDARGVGIAGGIFVGGELGVAVTALAGGDKLWMYLTFPFVGAAGGAVGGYFLEKASPEGAVALLVGGLALLIPTAILASRAMAFRPGNESAKGYEAQDRNAYAFEAPPTGKPPEEPTATEVESRPPEGQQEDSPPSSGEDPPTNDVEETPPAEDGDASLRMREKRRHAHRHRLKRVTAGSLLYVTGEGNAGLTIPFVDVRPARFAYNRTGAKPGVEVYLPLLRIDLP